MPETTAAYHPVEPYDPISKPNGAVEPMRDGRPMPAVSAVSTVVEAARLLLDGQQLLQESRTAEAEPLLRRALELYERQDKIPAGCVQVLTDLATIATTRGDLITAESLLQRALPLANAHLGADHADVAAILSGLARLCLRRSDFTKAEPLLQQLLQIKRARGDDHPEVATVLASLATVHSAIGAHESAERILRRVLAIRERALAPNHFATMMTLEHLAESCAARGKFEEALALLHRAMAMRERTLGVLHPSVAAARTRIADLELLSSNEELGWVPMSAPMMSTFPEIDARLDEPVESDPPPPVEAVAVSEPPPGAVSFEPPPGAVSFEPPSGAGSEELYDEQYDQWEDELEEPQPELSLSEQFNAKVELVTAFARTPRGRLTVVAIGVASLLAALVLAIRTRTDVAVASANASTTSPGAETRAALKPKFIVRPAPASASAGLPRSTELARQSRSANAGVRRSERSDSPEAVANDSEAIALPNAPTVGAFETPVVGAPIAPVDAPLVASTEFTPSPASPTQQATAGDAADRARRRTARAVLPADNPAPEYPRDLERRRIEGRVVAEFLVDAKGRVDTRTLRIVSSTDERFSQAVRDVLPRLRFLPAVSDGVKSEDWVEMPFRFSPTPE
jgi:TonB family protein